MAGLDITGIFVKRGNELKAESSKENLSALSFDL